MFTRVGVAAIITVLFIGCSGESREEAAAPDTIELTETHMISADQEDVLIGAFSGLAVGDKGTIYAADTKEQRIYAFSPEGHFLDTLGRRGKGPGEFSNLDAGIRVLGDTLYALQKRERRIDLFNRQTGESIRTVSIPDEEIDGVKVGSPYKIFPQRDGSLLVTFRNPNYRAPEPDAEQKYARVARLDASGSFISRELLRFPTLYPSQGRIILMEPGRVSVFSTNIYPTLQMAIRPSGTIYAGTTDSLKIIQYSREGVRGQVFEGEFAADVFTEADLDTLVKQGGDTYEKAVRNAGVPGQWPAFRDMILDDEGRLWVSLMEPDEERRRWWLFGGDGGLQGQADVPEEVTLYAINNGRAYGIARPDGALPEVRVYTVGE